MSLSISTGTYAGNATARSITGVGFTPKMLLLWGDNSTVTTNQAGLLFKTDTMGSKTNHYAENAWVDGISSIDADGFSLTTSVVANADTKNYYWAAFAGTDVVTGYFDGNGADNRDITGVGFTPGLVICGVDQGYHIYWRSDAFTGDSSAYGAQLANVANAIQAFSADGFQVGNISTAGMKMNESGARYHYCAISSLNLSTFTYSGNSSDNRDITLTVDPVVAFIKRNGTSAATFRHSSMSGDNSATTTKNGSTLGADRIQAFGSLSLQVGTDTFVNASGSTYFGYAFSLLPPTALTEGLLVGASALVGGSVLCGNGNLIN